MNKDQTLKKSLEIEKLVKAKQSVGNKYYAIYYNNINNDIKIAVSVSKKVGCAVVRNYQKRVTKEIVRSQIERLKGLKLLIVVKTTANNLSFEEKINQLSYLFNKIIKENKNEKL